MRPILLIVILVGLLILCSGVLNAQWIQTNGPYGGKIECLAVSGMDLFAGTDNGVFHSSNNGTSWVNSGLNNGAIFALVVSGNNLFATSSDYGVFLSTNNGTSWSAVDSGLTGQGQYVYSLAAGGTNLFAGTADGVFLSTNNGTNWTAVDSGLTGQFVNSLAISGSNLFAGTHDGVFLSTNSGTSWTAVNSGLTTTYIYSLAVGGTNLFAGTGGAGVSISTNNGRSWIAANSGLTNGNIFSLAFCGTDLFAGTADGVFLSTDNGTTWSAVSSGLTNNNIYSLAFSGTDLFAGTGGGVWRRPLWEFITPAPPSVITSVQDVPFDQGGSVTVTWRASSLDTNVQILPFYSVWRALPPGTDRSILKSPTPRITSNFKGAAYRVTAAGDSSYAWEWIKNLPAHRFDLYSCTVPTPGDSMAGNSGLCYFLVSAQTDSANNFYDSNVDSGYSIDNLAPPTPANPALTISDGAIYLHWNQTTAPDFAKYVIYKSLSPITGHTNTPPWATTPDTSYVDLAPGSSTNIFYVIKAEDVHGNLSNPSVELIASVLGVKRGGKGLPAIYSLFTNYPNPFNPTTQLQYALPQDSKVTMRIYNVLGQIVATLVYGIQPAGYKTAMWDGSACASGVYFYRLDATSISDPSKHFSGVKKMLLVR